MCDIPARMKQRGGVSLPSREEFFIQRQPPSSIFTRKHEPVTEAEVMWMTRPDGPGSDPTRINQAIQYFAKGINPSVEVDYQNRGSSGMRTTHIKSAQVGSAYKLDVVRPPLFPVETTHSLSNPRTHQTISVNVNPGLSQSYATSSIESVVDYANITNAVNNVPSAGPKTIQATAYYKLDTPAVMSAKFAINENRPENYETMTNPGIQTDVNDFVCREQTPYGVIIRPTYSVTANPNAQKELFVNGDASAKVRKEVLLQNIRPNFNIVLYDPTTHTSVDVSANVREKNYIAVNAALGKPLTLDRQDGTKIRLKNYQWTAVNTNLGVDQVILTIEDPNIQLERNLPIYATSTGLTAPTDLTEQRNQEYDLPGKVAAYAGPSMDLSAYYNQENARYLQDTKYGTKDVNTFSFDNQGSARPMSFDRQMPRLRDNSLHQQAVQQHYGRLFE